jgi:CDP-paratose 2-epimerase
MLNRQTAHIPSRFENSGGPVLITGGCGFIGTNLADRILSMGRHVVILDNLSRSGVDRNALWLQQKHGRKVRIVVGDVRNREDIRRAIGGVEQVFHLAAQVAVTASLADPRADFECNVLGTLNLLEAIRETGAPPSLVYTSTNKVYGGLEDISLHVDGQRYQPVDAKTLDCGISESRALDFHTPYGCSKGAAEQYVLEYARSYGQPAAVFRMSCIYGPHQFGTEDQGWVAHFLIRAIEGKSLTLYGDGMQVRDILFVDDLVNAFLLAQEHMPRTSGQAFNVGGGPQRTTSLLELVDTITRLHGRATRLYFETSRVGDQRYYVSDTSKLRAFTGWVPRVHPRDGVRRLYDWLIDDRRVMPQELAAS